MKSYVWMAALLCGGFVFQSCDKDDDIDNPALPQQVSQDFSVRYPDVSYADWEQEKGSKKYKAEFFYNDTHSEWGVNLTHTEAKAWYLPSGEWEKTEFDILPLYFSNDT